MWNNRIVDRVNNNKALCAHVLEYVQSWKSVVIFIKIQSYGVTKNAFPQKAKQD